MSVVRTCLAMATVLAMTLGVLLIWRGPPRSAPAPPGVGSAPATEAAPAPAPDAVALEAVSTPQPDPFTAPVGADQAGLSPVETAGGTLLADSPGVYGVTAAGPACDRERLIALLRADPRVADAWAGVLDIDPDAIPGYVRGLSPAILRSDTFLTDHGYADGDATEVPAVLQAGTAVLVDRFGQPAVKCSCGDPLTPPMGYLRAPSFHGLPWAGFTPGAITVIRRSPVMIDRFVMADVPGGAALIVVPGTAGYRPAPPGTALQPAVLHDHPWSAAGPQPSASPGTSPATPPTGTEPSPGTANPVPHAVPSAPADGSTPPPVTTAGGPPDTATGRQAPATPPTTATTPATPATPAPNPVTQAPPAPLTQEPPAPVTTRQPRTTAASPPTTTVPGPPATTTGPSTATRRSERTPATGAPTAGPPPTTTRQSTGQSPGSFTTRPPAGPATR